MVIPYFRNLNKNLCILIHLSVNLFSSCPLIILLLKLLARWCYLDLQDLIGWIDGREDILSNFHSPMTSINFSLSMI